MNIERPCLKKNIKVLVLIFLLLLPALFFGLGERPLYKIQEVRVAETAREMLVSQDWLIPRYNGELRLQKPPLPYWLTASSYRLFGVSEFAARVPSVIFTLLTAWLLFAWISKRSSLSFAANTALILVTTFMGLRYSRSAEADAALMFFITLACLAGYEILQGQVARYKVVLFYIAIGLAFLTKGPAGIAIPILTLIMAALCLKQLAQLKAMWSPLGIAFFVVIAFGWYVWIFIQLPELAQQFVSRQVDETFISGTHVKPLWWYLIHAFDFFAPWSILLIPACVWASKAPVLSTIVKYGLAWLFVVFILLTLTVNKQVQYALLFAPPISILIGAYLEYAEGRYARLNKIGLSLLQAGLAGLSLYLLYKQSLPLSGLVLLLGVILLVVMKRLWLVFFPTMSIYLVASLSILSFVYGELDQANDPEKTDAPSLMAKYKDLNELYQGTPGDGAISYYAGRPIKPLSEAAIAEYMKINQTLLLISKDEPVISGISAKAQDHAGQLTLWQLTQAPK